MSPIKVIVVIIVIIFVEAMFNTVVVIITKVVFFIVLLRTCLSVSIVIVNTNVLAGLNTVIIGHLSTTGAAGIIFIIITIATA
ncbi:hypothetical protein GU3_00645 [Oceanimonas sp. GK1]|nr:hypothetical protein GU3_00645 [Oceanimonas sp. GK1]